MPTYFSLNLFLANGLVDFETHLDMMQLVDFGRLNETTQDVFPAQFRGFLSLFVVRLLTLVFFLL